MLFAIAKPISREQFLKLYRDISFLTKLLFAPFGISDQTIAVLGESEFTKLYSTIYQQLEDIISKCVFRCQDLDDDRIIASMHKFVSQNQDSQVVSEIKSGADSIREFANPDPVVEFDFQGCNYDELFSVDTTCTLLSNIIDALRELKSIIEASNNCDTYVSKLNVDGRIRDMFDITVGTRICNPIVEMYNISTLTPSIELSPVIEKLTNAFKVYLTSFSSVHLEGEKELIALNYQQYVSLLHLSAKNEAFAERVKINLQLHCNESNEELNFVEAFQCGKLLYDMNLFLHPTVSFVMQITPLLRENPDCFDNKMGEGDETHNLRVKAHESMNFILDALQKSTRAKELAEMEQIDESIQLLSEDLLDLLDGSGKELNEDENDVSECSVECPIVPIFLQTTLLLQRAVLYLQSGNVELALGDIQNCIFLEPLCAEAYSIRSQIIFSGLQHVQLSDSPDADFSLLSEILTETMKQQSLCCLSELLPVPIVGSKSIDEVEDICAFQISDLLLHQAAEDALLAFILGGSNDIALAASAEEAARETCRKFAKKVYEHRHKEILKTVQSTSLGNDKSFVSTEHFPHNWLIQTYFSGYESLSSALQVCEKPVLSEELKIVLNSKLACGDFDIDEGEHENSSNHSLKLLPPDYLITHSDLDGYDIKQFDVEGYNLLFYIVSELESVTLDGVSCEAGDDSVINETIVNDEVSDKDIFYNVAISKDEENLEYLVDSHLVSCGKLQQKSFDCNNEDSSILIKEQSLLFETIGIDSQKEVDLSLHKLNGVCDGSFESSEFKAIVSILRQSIHLTGLELHPNGFVEDFNFHFDKIQFPEEVHGDGKLASNRDKKVNKKSVEPSEFFYADNDEGDDDDYESEEEAYEKMRDAFASHFGFANESDNRFGNEIPTKEDKSLSNVLESKTNSSGLIGGKVNSSYANTKVQGVSADGKIDDVNDDDDDDVWEDISDESSDATMSHSDELAQNADISAGHQNCVNSIEIDHSPVTVDLPVLVQANFVDESKAQVKCEQEYPISTKIRARLLNVCGSVCYLCGDSIGAIKCFEASLFLDPFLSDSKIKLAALLIDMDEPHKADHLLKEVRSADPANPVVYLHLGELAINGNNFDEAGSMLRQANRCMNMGWRSSSNPCSQSFVVNEEKTEQCRSLIHSSIYALLGVSMLRTNPHKPEFALHLLEEGLQRYPKSLMLLLCQGEIHAQCGDMIKAINLFSQVYKLKPFHPLALVNAGRTYQQLGQYHAAYEHIVKSLEVDSTFAMSYIDLAQLLRLQPKLGSNLHSNVPNAIVAIEEAIPLSKQVSEIRDVLTARYVTLLQKALKNKGFINNNVI